jgi:hypothetical protein
MRLTGLAFLIVALLASGVVLAEEKQSPDVVRRPNDDVVERVLRFSREPGPSHMGANLVLKSSARRLFKRSPTFAEMVRRLDQPGRVLLFVRSSRAGDRSVAGHTWFRAASALLIGQIEVEDFPIEDVSIRPRILAHELAHVYEVACLPRDIGGVRNALVRRSVGRTRDGLETPFAVAVERITVSESRQRETHASQLDALARQFGVCAGAIPPDATTRADTGTTHGHRQRLAFGEREAEIVLE